jgi:hypothetical protein
MRLAALCLFSAMFPVSLHALTADEMVLKPPLENHGELPAIAQELYVFGLSYHPNEKYYNYNGENPGLAYGMEFFSKENKYSISASFTCAFGTYKDSYSEQAYFAGIGPRITWGDRNDWHAAVGFLAGYLDGSGKKGATYIPMAFVNYGKVGIGFTGDPERTPHGSEMIAVFLKFTLATN